MSDMFIPMGIGARPPSISSKYVVTSRTLASSPSHKLSCLCSVSLRTSPWRYNSRSSSRILANRSSSHVPAGTSSHCPMALRKHVTARVRSCAGCIALPDHVCIYNDCCCSLPVVVRVVRVLVWLNSIQAEEAETTVPRGEKSIRPMYSYL
jgi:hypothetical protein